MNNDMLTRIEERLRVVGLTASAASVRAGLSPDAIRNFQRAVRARGKEATLNLRTLEQLAPVLGTTVSWLTTGEAGTDEVDMPGLRVSTANLSPVAYVGKTAAGVFREVDELDQSEPVILAEPIDEQFPNARRMAFEAEGDSMNDLKPRPILNGDRLICVAFEDVADKVRVRDGLVVVVERRRDGGMTREWSVKQVELYEDRVEFHPRSTNPRHKPIVVPRDALADEGTEVEIIALVRRVSNEFPY